MVSISSLVLITALFSVMPEAAPPTQEGSAYVRLEEKHSGPEWTSYGDALEAAKKSGKKVLVDVYTDWCGWCKKMDKNVYTDKTIRAYINEHYVAVKLDAESKSSHAVKGEKMTEKDIARAYGIRSFPTTVFLDSEGEPITAVPGYIEAGKFILVLKYISEEHYKNTKWEEYVSQNG